jgi:hypothetical protein
MNWATVWPGTVEYETMAMHGQDIVLDYAVTENWPHCLWPDSRA